jgi:glutamate/aspartate transport system substrate-binding protein
MPAACRSPVIRLARHAVSGALIVCAAAGLAPSSARSAEAGVSELSSRTLAKIRQTGVISVGYRLTSVPFSYLDARRRPIGYSMDLCSHVVRSLAGRLKLPQLQPRFVAVSSATRLPMLKSGAIDLECGTTTNTAERKKLVDFSVTTFVAASRLLAKKTDDVQRIEDLRGEAVSTTLSSTSMLYLTAVNEERRLGMRILAGVDDADAFDMVRSGRAVAFAMDDVLLRGQLAQVPDAQAYAISEEALTVEPYAIGVPHNDKPFKALVDEALIELYRSGRIDEIYDRWFMAPIPPNGINLKLPMSEGLRRVIEQPTDDSDPRRYRMHP